MLDQCAYLQTEIISRRTHSSHCWRLLRLTRCTHSSSTPTAGDYSVWPDVHTPATSPLLETTPFDQMYTLQLHPHCWRLLRLTRCTATFPLLETTPFDQMYTLQLHPHCWRLLRLTRHTHSSYIPTAGDYSRCTATYIPTAGDYSV